MSTDGDGFGRWAMQHVCPHCLHRHNLAVVAWVSAGVVPCAGCGRRIEPMTRADYFTTVADTAEAAMVSYTRVWR